MKTEIEELDVVTPLADVPGTPISAGQQGAVVAISRDGAALLIEFADGVGVTIAEAWLKPSDVRLVWSAKTGRYVSVEAGTDASVSAGAREPVAA